MVAYELTVGLVAGGVIFGAPGQLSVEVAEKVTLLLLHWPASVLATMGAGQPIPGASASLIVTVKVQPLVLPEVSVARQLTRVMPLSNVEPLAGVQIKVAPGQLSVDAAKKVTLLLLHWPASVVATMGAGQPIPGASVSLIVTVKVQQLVLAELSVGKLLTIVPPLLNVLPLAGVQG